MNSEPTKQRKCWFNSLQLILRKHLDLFKGTRNIRFSSLYQPPPLTFFSETNICLTLFTEESRYPGISFKMLKHLAMIWRHWIWYQIYNVEKITMQMKSVSLGKFILNAVFSKKKINENENIYSVTEKYKRVFGV